MDMFLFLSSSSRTAVGRGERGGDLSLNGNDGELNLSRRQVLLMHSSVMQTRAEVLVMLVSSKNTLVFYRGSTNNAKYTKTV
jgi:hypothetical protein